MQKVSICVYTLSDFVKLAKDSVIFQSSSHSAQSHLIHKSKVVANLINSKNYEVILNVLKEEGFNIDDLEVSVRDGIYIDTKDGGLTNCVQVFKNILSQDLISELSAFDISHEEKRAALILKKEFNLQSLYCEINHNNFTICDNLGAFGGSKFRSVIKKLLYIQAKDIFIKILNLQDKLITNILLEADKDQTLFFFNGDPCKVEYYNQYEVKSVSIDDSEKDVGCENKDDDDCCSKYDVYV